MYAKAIFRFWTESNLKVTIFSFQVSDTYNFFGQKFSVFLRFHSNSDLHALQKILRKNILKKKFNKAFTNFFFLEYSEMHFDLVTRKIIVKIFFCYNFFKIGQPPLNPLVRAGLRNLKLQFCWTKKLKEYRILFLYMFQYIAHLLGQKKLGQSWRDGVGGGGGSGRGSAGRSLG